MLCFDCFFKILHPFYHTVLYLFFLYVVSQQDLICTLTDGIGFPLNIPPIFLISKFILPAICKFINHSMFRLCWIIISVSLIYSLNLSGSCLHNYVFLTIIISNIEGIWRRDQQWNCWLLIFLIGFYKLCLIRCAF